jgi:hypothetical protein
MFLHTPPAQKNAHTLTYLLQKKKGSHTPNKKTFAPPKRIDLKILAHTHPN